MTSGPFVNERELRDATGARDAQSVGAFEVRYTDPDAFIEELKVDAQRGHIEGSIVRLAIVGGIAMTSQIVKSYVPPNEDKHQPSYRSRYVEASYLTHGQLIKLSAYCGIAWASENPPNAPTSELSTATGLRLQETARKVQAALSRLEVEVRGGGALHVHDLQEPWMALPETSIEMAPELICATCGERVYWANKSWRHLSTRRAEATREGSGAHGPIEILDHLAHPEEVGKVL